ncbi:MAG: AAA family ATPase [Desulfuromonadales bacterium]|jgi:BioD-like phosphotransacetylase family protein|nr:AAA family ATPase [Desulfuromonadales bacterium]
MARKLFIAATGQDCGKTTTSLSLLHLARKKYRRIGFIKPVGPKPARFHDRWMDKDAALVAKVYGLEDDLEWMSPVVLQPGDTRKLLDGKASAKAYEEQLLAACAEMDKRCDFLIIEGAGHSGVGSVLGLSNARVAHMVGAPVLMVTGGGIGHVIDDVSMNMALYQKEGAEVRFVMPNKLIASKRDRTLHYLSLASEQYGFDVHGGFNFSPILAGPTFKHVAKLLGLPMRASKEQGLKIIHHIQLGAASAERVVNMLDYSTLLVVTSSRDELLVMMAALYHIPEYHERLAGIIIAGFKPVSKITQTILDNSNLPFMRAEQTTADVFDTVTRDVSKITAEDTEKITLIQSLAEEYLDFDRIDAGLG